VSSLARAAEAIALLPRDRRTLVAIDGLDGAGKTAFADRLAPLLERPVVRVREDDFVNPAATARLLDREGKPNRPRYILGLKRYFEARDPRSRASLVLPW
jgi:MoxR-like ATPase